MKTVVKYELLVKYRMIFDFFYRALKKMVRLASNHLIYSGCLVTAYLSKSKSSFSDGVSSQEVGEFKKRWKGISNYVPKVFLEIYQPFSGIKTSDFVPDSIFFTHIEPIMNNVEFSRSFADKNMYSLLIDHSFQPKVLLRRMHGRFLDSDYHTVYHIDDFLSILAVNYERVIIKPSILSQGGRRIRLLESRDGKLFFEDAHVTLGWLSKEYNDNFLIQEYVQQHPFYSAFNSSSLNTLRIYTYRSVKDEKVHILSSMLRVGKPGYYIDNISLGGKACGLFADGRLNGIANDYEGKTYKRVGNVDLTLHEKVVGFEDVIRKAKKVAETQYYSRLIGFDFCVNEQEQGLLIELNNYDVGIERVQKCNGPLFGDFTDEIIDYCRKKKGSFKYIIR
ncbi:sugar-transfer associated ATP-grasp domain-containing protein [Anaerophaga thermohalophila]|uniref:sugar-transfer associated ATP-grasp domain-containing protein n=1 Tax=Anaerophaga thermohalophila TaxID=177400 RepID=UPI0002E7D164|nr:sugar-transfer associated ATP-grasp domain-containing protein [Anaerophaga thermohalophila]